MGSPNVGSSPTARTRLDSSSVSRVSQVSISGDQTFGLGDVTPQTAFGRDTGQESKTAATASPPKATSRRKRSTVNHQKMLLAAPPRTPTSCITKSRAITLRVPARLGKGTSCSGSWLRRKPRNPWATRFAQRLVSPGTPELRSQKLRDAIMAGWMRSSSPVDLAPRTFTP